MATTRIKYRLKGFEELRRETGIAADLNKRGERIAQSAGPGYVSAGEQGKSRYRVGVYTYSFDAILDNARHNTLLRSLDAGR